MLNKLIMQLAEEKWGTKFVLEDPDRDCQVYTNNITYLYREAGSEETKIAVSVLDQYSNISNLEELENQLGFIYASTSFDPLDDEGNILCNGEYDSDDYEPVVMQLWMEALAEGKDFIYVNRKTGCEVCITDPQGKSEFYKMGQFGYWIYDHEPCKEILTKLVRGKDNKELSIVVTADIPGDEDDITIDYLNTRVLVPVDCNDSSFITRYFVEGNTVTEIAINGYDRVYEVKTTQYHLNEEGIVIESTLHKPLEVVSTNTLNKLAGRMYTGDSPVLTEEEREFIISSNFKAPSPIYSGKNLFVGHREGHICINLPQVGWLAVHKSALDSDNLPKEIKQEVQLYRNI